MYYTLQFHFDVFPITPVALKIQKVELSDDIYHTYG